MADLTHTDLIPTQNCGPLIVNFLLAFGFSVLAITDEIGLSYSIKQGFSGCALP